MMKYQLSFVLLLTPLAVFAEQHCPAIDAIKLIGGVYTAKATSGEEWVGILQGPLPKRAVLSVSVRRSSWLKVRTMETTSPGQESFKNALMICKPKTYSSICTMAVQPG